MKTGIPVFMETGATEPQLSLGEIAKVLRMPDSTIRGWLARGYFGLRRGDDQKRKTEGLAHAISLSTALWVGAVAELTKFGMPAKRAAQIARAFILHADVDQKTEETLRYPAALYPGEGIYTALVAHPGDDEGTIVRFDSKTALAPFFYNERSGGRPSALVVWLNFIDRDIRTYLQQRSEGA
jgi:hypothetical protein